MICLNCGCFFKYASITTSGFKPFSLATAVRALVIASSADACVVRAANARPDAPTFASVFLKLNVLRIPARVDAVAVFEPAVVIADRTLSTSCCSVKSSGKVVAIPVTPVVKARASSLS